MDKWPQLTKWFQKLWMTEPLFQICDYMKAYCSICLVQSFAKV